MAGDIVRARLFVKLATGVAQPGEEEEPAALVRRSDFFR
jgi:hypothetical protein